ITPNDPFRWRHYEGEIILCCVRWYLDFPLSYRHVAKLIRERGLATHHTCVFRWVQMYSPELDKRCRPYLRRTNKSYRVDETYIKVDGEQKYPTIHWARELSVTAVSGQTACISAALVTKWPWCA